MSNTYIDINHAFHGTLSQLLMSREAREVMPRGLLTKEIIGHSLTITEPWHNVLAYRGRKINTAFMAAEFLWIINGMNDARIIRAFNKKAAEFADDGLYLRGAYGPRVIDQLPYILQTLQADPESRQALLTIWRERPGPSRDIPCTVTMQFFVRDGALEMVTYMRSNDIWLGFPYDVFNFTMLQGYLASALGVEWGPYHHHVGSIHLYEPQFEQAQAVLEEASIEIPTHVMIGQLPYPMPPHVLAYFAGFVTWASQADAEVMKENLQEWLNTAGIDFVGWDALIRLCAFKFHGNREDLPGEFVDLLEYWDG